MTLTVGLAIDAASGFLIAALGVFVLTRRPRRGVNVAFAVFALGWGGSVLIFNLFPQMRGAPAPLWAFLPLGSACSLMYVLARFPRPLAGAGLAATAIGGLVLGVVPSVVSTATGHGLGGAPRPLASVLAYAPFFGALFAGAGLFTLRFGAATGPSADRERSQYALMTAALLMDPGIRTGIMLAGRDPAGLIHALFLAAIAATWIRNTTLVEGGVRRSARNIALLVLALPLVGLLLTDALGGYPPAFDSGILGVARTVGVAVLAYAILKHQLLDIDVKVKFTIRQSTLAAIFVGVFFVASETAQQLFSARMGPFLGIAAAGALLFALAPLQRFAEGVADAAMPGVKGVGEMTGHERLALYRDQLRLAWADGTLSADERRLLELTRDRLGIRPEDALRVEREVAPK